MYSFIKEAVLMKLPQSEEAFRLNLVVQYVPQLRFSSNLLKNKENIKLRSPGINIMICLRIAK